MEKYLRLYAEPETAALGGLLNDFPGPVQWANVLVVPACNESPAFLRPPPPCGGRSLLILVINEPVSAPRAVTQANQALAERVWQQFELQCSYAGQDSDPGFGLSLLRDTHAARDLLLVDRFSPGRQLPVRGGVGHARKIGGDLAVSLIHQRYIDSPWIHCSDADVQLPASYFTCSQAVEDAAPKCAALVYPYHHRDGQQGGADGEVVLATQLYELSLRYYVAGMKFAGSPYAFHTIGSTMAVRASHYAKVRGFPKREAGEDFYLLNKLAKVGSVLELAASPDCEAIQIEARRSDRVPFGTGAAVNRITDLADPVADFRFYHPAVFELLRDWLQCLPAIWQSGSSELTARVLSDQSDGGQGEGTDAHNGRQALLAALKELKTERALEHAFRQSRDPDQFARQVHTWFDAFRTLKLIHSLRDQHLPSVSYAELISGKAYCQLLSQNPDLMTFHRQLKQKLLEEGGNRVSAGISCSGAGIIF